MHLQQQQQQPQQQQQQQRGSTVDETRKSQETQRNGGDNIITITTASINECDPTNDSEQLKSHISQKLSEKITQLSNLQNPLAKTASNSNASQSSSTDATTALSKYKLSGCISFQENVADVHHRRGRRLNGLQLPLHPLQVFGWFVLIVFGITSYWVLIPSFHIDIQGPLYGLITGLYIVHVVSHVAALLIDPADRELRRVHRNDRIVPEFDRSKHAHVIENGRCHLCNIRTSSQRTKHCSVCNKCVGKFDHHCKWLNHCVGSRNYVAFLMCVVSAVIATLVIVAAVIAQIVFYYVQPEWLSFWYTNRNVSSESQIDLATHSPVFYINSSSNGSLANATNITDDFDLAINVGNASNFTLDYEAFLESSTLSTSINNFNTLITDIVQETLGDNLTTATTSEPHFVKPSAVTEGSNSTTGATISSAGIGTSDTVFLVLIGFLGLLAAITAGLLLHLCFFHIYISFLGLTTYEYIRNHRQAQEAKARNTTSTLPKNGEQHFSINPSKKTKNCGQIYLCSSVRHPNVTNPNDLRYFETQQAKTTIARGNKDHEIELHCCANSREYHQTALKTYYMCSLLEEGEANSSLGVAHISGTRGDVGDVGCDDLSEQSDADNYKTFHCCSTFGATANQRKASAAIAKSTLVSNLETLNSRRSYLQYTEQCTFCTFRIRSPIVSKRSRASNARAIDARRERDVLKTDLVNETTKPFSSSLKTANMGHQRCCMKAISKHQRWRRKWNCCSNVPDSPDVPNDIIATLAMRQHHGSASIVSNKMSATEIPVHFIKTANGGNTADYASRPTSPRSANSKARARNARIWPMPRLRHMIRMLNRYRRPRCHHNNTSTAVGDQIKQNQIRPLQLQSNSNGCQHQHGYDSSSPQPPSTTTASERSSDQSAYSDSSARTTPCSSQPNTIETILPTSVIRDNTSMTYTSPMGHYTLPPALPPPTRRKIPNPTDLEELAETLSFSSYPSSSSIMLSPVQRLPALSNVYRRQRRKHFLRTRSPTLSPIHETGLSNPTSPQPGRHNVTSYSAASTATTAAVVVNNLGSSSELMRKTLSNSSLQSVSSNSSNT